MAKSKSSRHAGRDHSPIARPSGLPRVFSVRPVNLALFEDRRFFHPLGPARPAFAFPKSAARVVVPRTRSRSAVDGAKARTLPHQLTFAAPDRVLICVRRKRRKEVLFAKRKAGKRGQRKPRRNYWSAISCKK